MSLNEFVKTLVEDSETIADNIELEDCVFEGRDAPRQELVPGTQQKDGFLLLKGGISNSLSI